MKHPHEQALALLAIHLKERCLESAGEPPSTEELALLLEGNLTGRRRQELMSHLCRDPALYQQWLSLVSLEQHTSDYSVTKGLWVRFCDATSDYFTDWRYASAGIATAALVLVVFIALPTQQPNSTHIAEIEATILAAERYAARSGSEQGLQRKNSQARAWDRECIHFSEHRTRAAGKLCLEQSDHGTGWSWRPEDEEQPLQYARFHNGWIYDLKPSENGSWFTVRRASQKGEHLLIVSSDQPLLDPNTLEIQRKLKLEDIAGYYWKGNTLILKRVSDEDQTGSSEIWHYTPTQKGPLNN